MVWGIEQLKAWQHWNAPILSRITPSHFGLYDYQGFKIVESVALFASFKQVRFPKSKRSRIRKKWAKQKKHKEMVISRDIICDKQACILYMHPNTAYLLRVMERANKRHDASGSLL